MSTLVPIRVIEREARRMGVTVDHRSLILGYALGRCVVENPDAMRDEEHLAFLARQTLNTRASGPAPAEDGDSHRSETET